MNVVYASNDGYARHLAVSLYSLLEHNQKAEELSVYILSVGMSPECEEKLRQVAEEFHRPVCFCPLGDLKERFSFDIDTRGFDISAMARLFAAQVLPDALERVLYLDCDTVVLQNLEELWKTDLGDKLLGMVLEPTAYEAMRSSIDLKKDDAYYNSGVLLIDLDKWRKERITEQLLEYYRRKGGNLFACDQDTLNGSLRGRIKTLPPKYNFFTNYRYFPYKTLLKASGSYKEVSPEEFDEAVRRPAVIHYMGDERPWIAGNRNYYRKYYEVYLARTPWRGTPKETGRELYMMVYFAMNCLTKICPPAREWISSRFGMKIIDSRKQKKEKGILQK